MAFNLDYSRFREPAYVSAPDDPEPEFWTHEIRNGGEWPIQNEHGLTVGYVDEADFDCAWRYDPVARKPRIVITAIHIRILDRAGYRFRNLDAEGDDLSRALAAAIRRWADTPDGWLSLKRSYEDAVEALIEERDNE